MTTDYNLLIQYIILGIIMLGVIVWIIRKITKKSKSSGNSCCGCALSEKCTDKKNDKRGNGQC